MFLCLLIGKWNENFPSHTQTLDYILVSNWFNSLKLNGILFDSYPKGKLSLLSYSFQFERKIISSVWVQAENFQTQFVTHIEKRTILFCRIKPISYWDNNFSDWFGTKWNSAISIRKVWKQFKFGLYHAYMLRSIYL